MGTSVEGFNRKTAVPTGTASSSLGDRSRLALVGVVFPGWCRLTALASEVTMAIEHPTVSSSCINRDAWAKILTEARLWCRKEAI